MHRSTVNSRPLLILALGAMAAAAEFDLVTELSRAKPGTVVQMPSGTFRVAGLAIPAGVTLAGAGAGRTLLEARGSANGLVVAAGATVQDLAVAHAGEAGIAVRDAAGVVLARLRISGCLTGVSGRAASGLRLESLLLTDNRRGVVLSGGDGATVVNCTLAGNQVFGLSLAGTANTVIFNNLIVGSQTGLVVADDTTGLALDANLYNTSLIGSRPGHPARATLASWRRLTGWDRGSIELPLVFAEDGSFRPASRLPWDTARPLTAGWGVPTLAGRVAPRQDLTGVARPAMPGLGAVEAASDPAAGTADGSFEVAADGGVVSAALYRPDGVMVAPLFHNLPVPAGRQEFRLPTRDQANRPIPAGAYDIRLVQSRLNNRYRGLAGNFARVPTPAEGCSWPEEVVAFDGAGRGYILQDSFENGLGVRALDVDGTTVRWTMPGGGRTVGWAVDEHWLYYLQRRDGGRHILRRLDLASGTYGSFANGEAAAMLSAPLGERLTGLALLGGRLFTADPVAGIIWSADAGAQVFREFLRLPGLAGLAADQANGRLWAFTTEGVLSAIDPATAVMVAQSGAIPGVIALAACSGRLAVLSSASGTVQVLDAADPANLRPLRTIGTGDGPGGAQRPDRFWFQRGSGLRIGSDKVAVSLSPSGEVVVIDGPRLGWWTADGRLRRQGLGFWGQHNYAARFTPEGDITVAGMGGEYSIAMDCRAGSWRPADAWERPAYIFEERAIRHLFAIGAKRFGVFAVTLGNTGHSGQDVVVTSGFDAAKQGFPAYLIMRLDERRMVPVLLTYSHPRRGVQVECHDANGNGFIDGEEGLVEVRRADGSPVLLPGARYGALPWNDGGDLMFAAPQAGTPSCAQIVRLTGLAPGGWPVYDWAGARAVTALGSDGGQPDLLSPYDFTTVERLDRTFQIAPFASGGYVQSAILKSSGGTGLANGAGTDLAGFGADGRLRWLFPLADREGSEGVQTLPSLGVALAMTSKECDYMAVDEDGLGLGVLSMPAESGWMGMWSDHAQQQIAWIGNDGSANYLLGDYALNGLHWFAIDGLGEVRRQRLPVQLGGARAAVLAAAAGRSPWRRPGPPETEVRIPRLAAPLPIDGDPAKWRRLGVPVAAVVTPESGVGITGPADCSAVIRLAWHDSDLYVQSIVFDDHPGFHQPVAQLYQQDGLEMAVEGFMEGFKFNVSRSTDHGDVVLRNRFTIPALDRLFTPAQVPRSITILPDSRGLEERRLIEGIYGIDLAASPAIVTEFRLSLTPAVGLDGDPALIPALAPGVTFRLGFMINDNDIRGSENQKYLMWPATYQTFGVKTMGAKAVLE